MVEKIKKIMEKLNKIPLKISIPICLGVFLGIFLAYKDYIPKPEEISYNKFIEMVDDKKITEIKLNLSAATFTFEDTDGNLYKTYNPKSQDFKLELLKKGVSVEENSGGLSSFKSLLLTFIQVGLMGLVIIYTYKYSTKSISEIKLEPEYPELTLNDIAGNEEAKEDLKHKIHSLIEPELYKKVGATITKGILLTGPPGTGKTLMARALAGESKIPFFSLSGSDFVEMYVGVGAKRIRQLFKIAKENTPCIIFIDELDAIGGKRNGQEGESEREQTLNALLVEMNKAEGVLVIAATNRPDMLDSALVRPGRFDNKVTMNNPSKEDRLKIIAKHLENKKISDDVDTSQLAKKTLGLSGADIASLINEAALLCAREEREILEKKDFDIAYIKTLTKGYQKTTKQHDRDRVITAWHEAGHALCTKLLTNKEIAEVSIIPTTSGVGGYTMSHSDKESFLTKEDILNEIQILYAGRAAEQIESNSESLVTTGASNDILRATQLLKDILGRYGMGASGMIDLSQFEDSEPILMNESVELSNSLYSKTITLLKDNYETLELIATQLLDKETLSGEEIEQLFSYK